MGFSVAASGHALVCGASRGIGRGAALSLARLGARITVLARDSDRLEALLPELVKTGAREVSALVTDLDRRDEAVEAVEALIRDHGPVHILINNTGGPPAGRLLDATEAQILAAIGRHLLVSQRMVQTVLPGMTGAGYGRIVNVLSSSVRVPIAGLGVSNLTRAAMASWAKTLSGELPPGVTINSVLPGKIDTTRLSEIKAAFAARDSVDPGEIERAWVGAIPEGRLGTTDEIGGVIAFLASEAGAFVRGVCLPVDGGQLPSI